MLLITSTFARLILAAQTIAALKALQWNNFHYRSNRGFDELVPHHIHVVNEDRYYQEWDVSSGRGITEAKKVFNDLHRWEVIWYQDDRIICWSYRIFLHRWMSNEGFSELFVDQMSEDVVAVTRHCPSDHRSVVTVVSTAFHPGVAYNQ